MYQNELYPKDVNYNRLKSTKYGEDMGGEGVGRIW